MTFNKLFLAVMAGSVLMTGCGSDGDNGTAGTNGTDGSNGADGSNSLIVQTALEAGDSNCSNGGVQIDSGLDSNADGVLSDAEITATQYVCNAGRADLTNGELATTLTNDWYIQSAAKLDSTEAALAAIQNARGAAKNVILFVGDGMGMSTITASRILEGQNEGGLGEENTLSFGAFPFTGLSKTYNVDAQTPDSAGTMTAMMSGVKTDVGVIGVDEDIVRGDCSTVAGNELVTALELAELAGKSTGIISTARITHATPAATYAKSADRNWEDYSDQPADAQGVCEDIASQLVNFEANLESRFSGYDVDGIEVVFGGGRRHFLRKDAADNTVDAVSSTEGDRTDGRNLVNEWATAYSNGVVTFGTEATAAAGNTPAGTDFDAIDTETTERVLGLFNESHMQYEADRGNDLLGEPSLSDMTNKAIGILDNNDDGFFLMVESGRIDHAHHAGNAFGALNDTIELSNAIQAAVDATDAEDTLIIVTADHGHVFTIAGYPKRGNPILGKVVAVGSDEASTASDGLPYTTVGYMNGIGFMDLGDETDSDQSYSNTGTPGRVDLTEVDTTAPGFHQEALVPLSSETHSGEDVGIYASGPGAHLVSGTNEQSIIFHVMEHAADLTGLADAVAAD